MTVERRHPACAARAYIPARAGDRIHRIWIARCARSEGRPHSGPERRRGVDPRARRVDLTSSRRSRLISHPKLELWCRSSALRLHFQEKRVHSKARASHIFALTVHSKARRPYIFALEVHSKARGPYIVALPVHSKAAAPYIFALGVHSKAAQPYIFAPGVRSKSTPPSMNGAHRSDTCAPRSS